MHKQASQCAIWYLVGQYYSYGGRGGGGKKIASTLVLDIEF